LALAAYNTEILTLPMSSVETIVDGAGKTAVVDARGRLLRDGRSSGGGGGDNGTGRSKCDGDGRVRWREVWNEGTDAVMDVPLGGVCEVLYGDGREDGDEDEEA
jgi:hypothetical protein